MTEQKSKIQTSTKKVSNVQLQLKRYNTIVKACRIVGYTITCFLLMIILKYVFYDRTHTKIYKLYDKRTNSYIQSVNDLEYYKCIKLSKTCLPLYDIDVLEITMKNEG